MRLPVIPEVGEEILLVWPNGKYKEKAKVRAVTSEEIVLLVPRGYTERYRITKGGKIR